MEDLVKELGPLIDNYVKKFEGSKVKKRDQLNENEGFKNRFTQLVENIIMPQMNKYYTLFEDGGFGVAIIRTNILHEAGHQIQPIISLTFSYKKSSYSEFIQAAVPSLWFVAENRKIAIYENKFDNSGLGSSGKEGAYEANQITESFVRDKISNFFKTLFNKD
jgi:hypothetical protein